MQLLALLCGQVGTCLRTEGLDGCHPKPIGTIQLEENQLSSPQFSLLACGSIRQTIAIAFRNGRLRLKPCFQGQYMCSRGRPNQRKDRIHRDHRPLSQVCPGGRLAEFFLVDPDERKVHRDGHPREQIK